MQPLVPAVPDPESPVFACFWRRLCFEVFWAGDTGGSGSTAEAGEGTPWPSLPQSVSYSARGLDGRMPEAYTLEQESVRQRVARMEHQGNRIVQGLNGEMAVHMVRGAQDEIRQAKPMPLAGS